MTIIEASRTVYNPVDGTVYADKRGQNVVQAGGADSGNPGKQTIVGANGQTSLQSYPGWEPGYFKVIIPWPNESNSNKPAEFFEEKWAVGTQHTVRFLTGSLLSGDYQQGLSVRFTIVDGQTSDYVAPIVETDPADATAFAGESASFTAAASGTPHPAVQWWKRAPGGAWEEIPGATGSTLTLSQLRTSMTGTEVRARFENAAGSAQSAAATLTVRPTPIDITTQPGDQTVEEGERVSFSARASGSELDVQWQRSDDGETWEPIRGATGLDLVLEPARPDDANWRYRAWFTNPGNVEGEVTRAAALTVTARENDRVQCGSNGKSGGEFCVTWPEKVVKGQPIVVRGTGSFLAANGTTGSVVGFTLDGFHAADQGKIYLKQPTVNPSTKQPFESRHIYAAVQANTDGTWTAEIPWPTSSKVSSTPNGSGVISQSELDARFAAGTRHVLHLDTGSLLSGAKDLERRASLFFTVVENEGDAVTMREPGYLHSAFTSQVPGDTAKAWVPLAADSGTAFPVTGTGWKTADGASGSVIDVRLKDENGTFFRHAGTGADPHPVADDPTIWQRVHARSDGLLDTRVRVPDAAEAGSYLVARLTTTSGTPIGDVAREWDSGEIVIDGVPYVAPSSGGCTASAASASYELAPGMNVAAARLGGTIRLTGKNWCNNLTGAGSLIAVKINAGAYAHKAGNYAPVYEAEAGKVTQPCTAPVCTTNFVWYVIIADDRGNFDVDIPVPSRSNSTPAFTEGSYTLQLLTGTLSEQAFFGGTKGKKESSRSERTREFTVVCETCDISKAKPGKPTASPDPLHAVNDLTDAKRGGVSVAQGAGSWVVTVPKGKPGDWVYVNVYGGSTPRFPWGIEWFQLNGRKQANLPLAGIQLPTGANKLSVQDRGGGLLGWATVTVAAPAVTAPVVEQRSVSGVRFAPTIASAPKLKPTTVPEQPVARYADLTSGNSGGITSEKKDGKLVVTLPEVEGGDWVFLFIYTEKGRVVPVDWVQAGSDRTILLDISKLPSGKVKFAFVNEDEELVGWVLADGSSSKDSKDATAGGGAAIIAGGGSAMAAVAELLAGPNGDLTLILVGLALLILAGSGVAVIMLRAPMSGPAPRGPTPT